MEQKNSVFDETSNRWVKIFKVFVIVVSSVLLLGGLITLIAGCDLMSNGGVDASEGSMAALIGLGALVYAIFNYFLGMLITNVVYNIQKTRECVELMAKEKGTNTDSVNTNTTNANNDLPTL